METALFSPLGSPSTSSTTYSYDPIGNRIQAVENSVQSDYVSNVLNQYTAINVASPSYDDDGNMLTTGSGWTLGWDGENRLITASNANTVITNTYDPRSRRIRKQVADAGTPVSDKRFFYDGWSLLHEHDVIAGTPVTHYLWGLDLSGSLQGAGGVGGLLAEIRSGQVAASAADANGNITEYLNGQTGGILSPYAYDGFGKTIAAPGIQDGSVYLHRFSSKYLDAEIGWYYYGYRFYAPEIGRWPSRDPIQERGGVNLYGFLINSPLGKKDILGLSAACSCGPDVTDAIGLAMTHQFVTFSNLSRRNPIMTERICKMFTLPFWQVALDPDLLTEAKSAWDFEELTWGWDKLNATSGCNASGSCSESATFMGVCYSAWYINYMHLGQNVKMCGGDVENMKRMIQAWKLNKRLKYPEQKNNDAEIAISFAMLGYNYSGGMIGQFPVILPQGNLKNCKPCGKRGDPQMFTSKWPQNMIDYYARKYGWPVGEGP